MIIPLILLLIGLVILAKSSYLFIDSSKSIARHFGVTEFIIGLTLVSIGTSLPEFGASVYASYTGSGGIAAGNIVGSNIANIALILGVSLLFGSMKTSRVMLKRDGYIMLAATVLFAGIAIGGISKWDGLILIVCFVLYMRILYIRRRGDDYVPDAESHPITVDRRIRGETTKLVAGGAGVFLGTKLLVDSAIDIALMRGVSENVIGVTLVAFGTSVPELAVSISSIIKRSEDIVIGNIIGSNIFNILWVGGIASLVGPLSVDSVLLRFNVPLMILVAILLLVFMRTGWKLERWEGAVFVTIYIGFILFNIYNL